MPESWDIKGREDAVRVESKGEAGPLPGLLETSPRLRAPGSYILLLSRMRLLLSRAPPALPDSIATHAHFLQTGTWQALQGGEGLTRGFWPVEPAVHISRLLGLEARAPAWLFQQLRAWPRCQGPTLCFCAGRARWLAQQAAGSWPSPPSQL